MTASGGPALTWFATEELDPYARGLAAGAALSDRIRHSVASYRTLFRVWAGLDDDAVLRFGDAALARILAFRPALARELDGLAAGSGHRPELIAALNARTEAIAGTSECSTVGRGGSPDGPWLAQNWDWYADAADRCALIEAPAGTTGERFLTVTEAGLLAKLGVSSRGLAVSLNILAHRRDGGAPGVPVHLLLREILGECGTVDDVGALLADVPTSASSALSVVDGAGDAATFELSPAGPRRVDPDDRLLAHTNHFLSPELALDEASTRVPGSIGRLAALRGAAPQTLEQGLQALCEHDCGPQAVCRHGEPPEVGGLPEVATVLSLAMRPAAGRLGVALGTPCRARFVEHQVAAVPAPA